MPYDHRFDDTDFDPDHPDLQHEQPPTESTDDPADFEIGHGEQADPGTLPYDLPAAPQDMPHEVATGDEPDGDQGDG